jgi:N-acyl-D-aspartate/D-glutamate deacylase
MGMHDLLIKGATIVDGTGGPPTVGDLAITNGIITHLESPGDIGGSATRTIQAEGALVTPGFVDIHTHYDGQATWDSQMLPSSWHGVTTVVMSNCGVGFAPVKPHDRDRLIELMEGVEDIPGTALHEGLDWRWESMDEYLNVLGEKHRDVDIAAQFPHGALRLFVMGERGANGDLATADDIAEMSTLTEQAILAGALGFTSSRTKNHRTLKGAYTPSLRAGHDELVGIAAGLRRAGAGVLQMVSDLDPLEDELDLYRKMLIASGRPLSLSLLQVHRDPEQWKSVIAFIEQVNGEGHTMRAQVAARPVGLLMGLQATVNPLMRSATYRSIAGVHGSDFAAIACALSSSEVKLAVLNDLGDDQLRKNVGFDNIFSLGAIPDYEPDPSSSLSARAAVAGVDPMSLAYDELIADSGTALLYAPIINYANGNLDHAAEMIANPFCVAGLSDGGAHVGTICDASFPTTLLAHWGRDRARGVLPIEMLVASQTRKTAATVGLMDRGLLAPGMRADINVIDHASLQSFAPEIHYDLPANGRRLLQRAQGYRHTFVAGVETYANGEFTGQLPGRLVRGAQTDPR